MTEVAAGRAVARRTVRALVTGGGLGLAAWLLGMDPGHAAAVAAASTGIAATVGAVVRVPDPAWPDGPDVDAGRGWHGAALQSRLLERLDAEPERIPRLLLPRLRSLLAVALARHGVADPGSARARELVGAGLHDLLSRSTWTARGLPTATELTAAVVARLDDLRAPDRGAPDREPAPGPSR